ncbi:hypothetical protein AAMO2058_001289200 [Amorphochlora amoebiformis]
MRRVVKAVAQANRWSMNGGRYTRRGMLKVPSGLKRAMTTTNESRVRACELKCIRLYHTEPGGALEATTYPEELPASRDVEFPATERLKCEGCGIELQCHHEDSLGFIPRSVYERTLKGQRQQSKEQKQLDGIREEILDTEEDIAFLRNKISTKKSSKNPKKIKESESLQQYLEKRTWRLEQLKSILKKTVAPDLRTIKSMGELKQAMREVRLSSRMERVCKRCHHLRHYGLSRGSVSSLSAYKFSAMLRDVLGNNAKEVRRASVVVKLVDIFDVQGTILKGFHEIVSEKHRLILVANKADLLPSTVGPTRATAWLRSQAKAVGLNPQSVHLVSAKYPRSVEFKRFVGKMIQTAQPDPIKFGKYRRADKAGALDIYFVGATNVGKSTLVNALIDCGALSSGKKVTTSGLPGTTLGLVKFRLRAKTSKEAPILYDTPGVVDRLHLMHRLPHSELDMILPRSRLKPVTYKIKTGQVIMIGALAMIEQVAGKPFFFTIVASPQVTVHVTRRDRVEDLLLNQAGVPEAMIFPPHSNHLIRSTGLGTSPEIEMESDIPDVSKHITGHVSEDGHVSSGQAKEVSSESLEAFDTALGSEGSEDEFHEIPAAEGEITTLEFKGKGWREACAEVVLPGLGWVGLTGAGSVGIKVHTPPGMTPVTRDPLLPFDALPTSKKFSGHPSKRF